jgi:deoxyadenosine/deoxycytidine kinase
VTGGASRRARRYVVVEGVIGVGKTTLVHQLVRALGGRAVLEAFEDNPFLTAFYRDPDAHALSTQLFFLMSRFRQQEQLAQEDLFAPHTVADYLFDKDRIFAELNLGGAELGIYEQLFEVLRPRVPAPDLVVHLRADLDIVLERIRQRGRSYELDIDPGYLRALDAAYETFFAAYDAAPVVTVDTGTIDFRRPGPVFDAILEAIHTGAVPGRLDARGAGAPPALPGLSE